MTADLRSLVDAYTQAPLKPPSRAGITLTADGEPIGLGVIIPLGAVLRATVTQPSTDGILCYPPMLIVVEE